MKAAEEVLQFWFDDATSAPERASARNQVWFGSDPGFDREIERRFGELAARARRGELDSWGAQPRSALALVILLDQFSRNLFRGTAEAFAADAQALDVAVTAIEHGFDRQLHPVEAAFLYLPFEHAEDLGHQERCVRLYEGLAQRCDHELTSLIENYGKYAEQHRDIIRRFGRFPHRNGSLGRTSRPEEREYLERGGQTF